MFDWPEDDWCPVRRFGPLSNTPPQSFMKSLLEGRVWGSSLVGGQSAVVIRRQGDVYGRRDRDTETRGGQKKKKNNNSTSNVVNRKLLPAGK